MQENPYSGIVLEMQRNAQSVQFEHIRIGEVVSLSPFTVRIAGLDLTGESLRLAAHLKAGYEVKTEMEMTGIKEVRIEGAELGIASGTFEATGDDESRMKAEEVSARLIRPLTVGDTVVALTNDNQIFYVIEKVVEV